MKKLFLLLVVLGISAISIFAQDTIDSTRIKELKLKFENGNMNRRELREYHNLVSGTHARDIRFGFGLLASQEDWKAAGYFCFGHLTIEDGFRSDLHSLSPNLHYYDVWNNISLNYSWWRSKSRPIEVFTGLGINFNAQFYGDNDPELTGYWTVHAGVEGFPSKEVPVAISLEIIDVQKFISVYPEFGIHYFF